MAEAENLENEKEYFTRVHLALTECGTEVLCKLLLKKVKDLTPLDHPSIPWSLDEFLHYKKKDILSAIGKEKSKEDTLYPFRRDTDLEKWDISLFVHVILTACDLDANDQLHRQLKNDICNLRNLRNKIAHKQTHKLTETIYQSYYGRLQGSILRICEFIQEPDLQDSFEKKLNKYEYLGHVYANGLITDDNNKTEEVINEGDGTVESGLQQIKSIIQQKSLTVNIPVLDVMLMFRNYNKDDEQAVSERLHQLFSEALEKENIFETDDKHECVDFRAKLRNEVLSLVRKLFQEKRTIAKVSTGCLVLTIHCPDLDNVISFIQDSISGRLTELFSSLEEVMRTETSNESFDVYAGITKQSCWSLLNTLFCDVSKACHHSRFLIESIRQNEGVSIRILNFLENIQEKEHTADYIASNQTDEIRLQLSENLEQYIYQSGLEMDLFIQGKYEKSNVKESPVQELCYYEQNPTGPDKIPRVRRSSSVSCIFSNKNEDLREEVDSLEGIGSNGVQKWLDDFETHRREGNAIRSNLLESLDVTHESLSLPAKINLTRHGNHTRRWFSESDLLLKSKMFNREPPLPEPYNEVLRSPVPRFRRSSSLSYLSSKKSEGLREDADSLKWSTSDDSLMNEWNCDLPPIFIDNLDENISVNETTDALTLKYVDEMELLGTDGHWEDGNISGMDVVGDRFLVAADYKKKCMRCFDMDSGKQQVEWHDSGFLPRDITTIPGNRVAVTSAQEVWFLRVTENGDLLLENKINVKEDCYGIASSGNNLIVGRDHEVHMLDMKGKVIKEFKKDGDGKSLFDWPTSVAVSSDHSTIYITDKVNYTVTALTQDGCVLGVVDIEVLLPFESGITVDSAGRVYVCGFDNVFLVSIETGTVTPLLGITDGIRHPICVAVCDKTQCLYVSSLDSNVIQVFEMHNTLRRKI